MGAAERFPRLHEEAGAPIAFALALDAAVRKGLAAASLHFGSCRHAKFTDVRRRPFVMVNRSSAAPVSH